MRTSARLMTLKLQKAVESRLYGNGYVVILNKRGLYPRRVHIGRMICRGALWGWSFLMDLLVEDTKSFIILIISTISWNSFWYALMHLHGMID